MSPAILQSTQAQCSTLRVCVVSILLLCALVIFQMLGVSTTLVTAGLTLDLPQASVLEGLTLISEGFVAVYCGYEGPDIRSSGAAYLLVLAVTFFRPPAF